MPLPSLPGTDVSDRRGAGILISLAPGLLLFLMKGKIQYGRARMCSYVGSFAGVHCSALWQTLRKVSFVQMLATVLVSAAPIAIGLLVWALHASKHRQSVNVSRGVLSVGLERLALSSISRISIAPLYDVAPADDLWILEDKDGSKLSFLSRALGANAALARLEAALPYLYQAQALEKARNESHFEQPVVVWKIQSESSAA